MNSSDGLREHVSRWHSDPWTVSRVIEMVARSALATTLALVPALLVYWGTSSEIFCLVVFSAIFYVVLNRVVP